MGHTNETANLKLPQFIDTDRATWTGDINGAFQSIDAQLGILPSQVQNAGDKADSATEAAMNASQALSDLTAKVTALTLSVAELGDRQTELEGKIPDISGLETTVGQHTNQISGLETTVGQHTNQISELNRGIGTLENAMEANQSILTSVSSAVGNLSFRVVDAAVESPDENTLYFIKEEEG